MSRRSDAPPARRLLVAGAAGLVGSAVAEAAAGQGGELVLLGRSAAPLEVLAGRLNVPAQVVQADVTDPESVAAAVKLAGPVDAVVTLATGYGGRPVEVADLDTAEFRRIVETDLIGTYTLVRACLPALLASSAGRVVLVSSVAGLRGRPLAAHLCAAKAGVHGLGLGLAAELGGAGVRVNIVAPGPIARPGVGHPPSPIPPAQPEDVADAVLRLASADCDLQGQTVVVTGEAAGVEGFR